MGGWIALAPELMHQLVMIMQLAQRLGMLHGVDYRTPAGEIELWKAVAAGMETPLDVQGTPRQVAARLPVAIGRTRLALGPVAGKVAFAVVKRLVLKLSTPMGRLVPVVGGSISLVSNYLLMGRVGRRMMAYYARRHGPLDGAGRVVAVVEVVRGAPSFNGGDAELGWES